MLSTSTSISAAHQDTHTGREPFQAAPPLPTAGAGRALSVLLTLVRVRALGAEGGAHAVRAYPVPLRRASPGHSATASAPQELQLTLQVPLLALQRVQLVLALLIRVFKFLVHGRRHGGVGEKKYSHSGLFGSSFIIEMGVGEGGHSSAVDEA